MDKPTSSDEDSSEDQAPPQFKFLKSTEIRIEEIVEEEPTVEYGPHPPTTVVLSDSEDDINLENEIDRTNQHLWIIDPKNPLP